MINSLKAKTEDRVEMLDRMDDLVNIAEKRGHTRSEKYEFDGLESDILKLDEEIKELKTAEDKMKRKAFEKMSAGDVDLQDEQRDPAFGFQEEGDPSVFQIKKKAPVRARGPISDWVKRNYDIPEEAQDADVFKVIRALAGWKKIDKSTEAALATIKTVSANSTLTEFLSAQIFESGIARSHLGRSGMQTFLMQEPTVRFPRITEFPQLQWLSQMAASTERNLTIDSVDGVAATLRGFLSLAAEKLRDGHQIERIIRRAFSVALGNEIDRSGLYGSGTGEEPLGIASYVGLPVHTHNALITNYDPFVEAQKLVYDEDGPDLDTWLGSPDFWLQLTKLKGTNEFAPMAPPFAMSHHKFLQTSKAPQDEGGSGNASSIIGGGFSSLHFGIRLDSTVVVTPLQADTFSYNILGAMRGQFFAERVEDFVKIAGISPDTVT